MIAVRNVWRWQKPTAAWQRLGRPTEGSLLRPNLQGRRFAEDGDWINGKRQESLHGGVERSCRPLCRRLVRRTSGNCHLLV